MISKSRAYKNAMALPLRNHSYMIVTVGAINQVAQKNASCIGEYSYLSNLVKPFDSYDVEDVYATFEKDLFKLDGSMYLPPEDTDYLLNNGIISKNIAGDIKIKFNDVYDIRGFTIFFGGNHPTAFTISNGTTTKSYTNTSKMFVCEDVFNESNTITIHPTSMSKPNNRLRIDKMYMGVGITFENNKIQSSTFTETTDAITSSLPKVDFSLQCENYNRMFDTENKDSAIYFLEIGQDVTWKYGYEVDENTVDWTSGGVAKLSSWSADDTKLTIKAKDPINDLDDKYMGGCIYSGGITAFNLAKAVLTDAGVDSRKYSLDDYLKEVKIYNPLPQKTHKECLQIIANISRCKLYTDREGIIKIVPNFATVLNPDRMEVDTSSQTFYSSPKGILKADENYDYATFSVNQFRVDGSKIILPDSAPYKQTGFVSNEIARFSSPIPVANRTVELPNGYATVEDGTMDFNEDVLINQVINRSTVELIDIGGAGTFETNPKFKIELEAPQTFYGFHIDFDNNPPKHLIARTYLNGALVKTYNAYDLELENYIQYEFGKFDTIEIEFVKGTVNSRIFVSRFSFGDITDYYMSYNVLTDYPTGTIENTTSRIDVVTYNYSQGTTETNVGTAEVDVTNLSTYTIYLKDASSDISVHDDTASADVTIVSSTTNLVVIDVLALTGTHKFTVKGKKYDIAEKIISKTINTTGKVVEWKNPIIANDNQAKLVLEWIANYYKNDVSYDIKYRGEPRLEAEDIVFLENKYTDNLQIQLSTHTLKFSGGGLSGTAKARRAVNYAS